MYVAAVLLEVILSYLAYIQTKNERARQTAAAMIVLILMPKNFLFMLCSLLLKILSE